MTPATRVRLLAIREALRSASKLLAEIQTLDPGAIDERVRQRIIPALCVIMHDMGWILEREEEIEDGRCPDDRP